MNVKATRTFGAALAAVALPLALGSCGEDKEKQAEIDQLTEDLAVAHDNYRDLESEYDNLEEKRDELNRTLRDEKSRANKLERELATVKRDLERALERERREAEREKAASRAPASREVREQKKKEVEGKLGAIVKIEGDKSSGTGFVAEADGKTWIYLAAGTLAGNSKLDITQPDGVPLEKFGAFEVATGANLARLELLDAPENKLAMPTEPAELKSGGPVLGISDVGVVTEGRSYDPEASEMKADSRLGKCPVGTPVFNGETGLLLGVLTEPMDGERELWQRSGYSQHYRQRLVCRLDREVEWSAMPIASFLAESRTLAEADELTRLVHAFSATQPSLGSISLDSGLGNGETARKFLEKHGSMSAVRSLFDLEKWLEEKAERAAETDIRKRVTGVYGEIARASRKNTNELKSKSFSSFHRTAAKQSILWRDEAEQSLAETIKAIAK